MGRAYLSATSRERYLYVAGGYRWDPKAQNLQYFDDVLRSVIGADHAPGAWAAQAPFAHGRSGLGFASIDDCVFVVGGSRSESGKPLYMADAQYARAAADGSLAKWTTSPNALNVARSNHTLLATREGAARRLYVIGGVTENGPDTIHLDTVEVAAIAPDCSVGTWTVANYHFEGGRSAPQALLLGDTITIIGGWGDVDPLDVFADVQMTQLRSDGTLAPWHRLSGHLPSGVFGHATVSYATGATTLLLSVAGQTGPGAYSDWITFSYYLPQAPLEVAMTSWEISPMGRLPTARAGHAAAMVGDRLYVIGGATRSGEFLPDTTFAQIGPGSPIR